MSTPRRGLLGKKEGRSRSLETTVLYDGGPGEVDTLDRVFLGFGHDLPINPDQHGNDLRRMKLSVT